jgi:hypothetical protein
MGATGASLLASLNGSISWPACSMGMNPGVPPMLPRKNFSPGSALGQIGSVLPARKSQGTPGIHKTARKS